MDPPQPPMIDVTKLADNLARELTPILIQKIERLLPEVLAEALLRCADGTMCMGELGFGESADRIPGNYNRDIIAEYGDSFGEYDGDSFESYSDDTLEEVDTETECVSRRSARHLDNIVEEPTLRRTREGLDKLRSTVPNYRRGEAVPYPVASPAFLAEIRATVPRRENNDGAFHYIPRQDKCVFRGSHFVGRVMSEESVERYRKKQVGEEVKKESESEQDVTMDGKLTDGLVHVVEATALDNHHRKVSNTCRTKVKGWWVKMKKAL
jgi:hypothetical protein